MCRTSPASQPPKIVVITCLLFGLYRKQKKVPVLPHLPLRITVAVVGPLAEWATYDLVRSIIYECIKVFHQK